MAIVDAVRFGLAARAAALADPPLRRTGVREMRFHDLRQSFATLPLMQGAPPRVVMEMLGHS